ncbi:MAG: acetolactate decarboxylase [Methanoregulaceae archaeon]|nr:acetolactate decarboxylase [Methanoregulaceae archaeon]
MKSIVLASCATLCFVLATFIAVAGIPGQEIENSGHDVFYQVSTIDALMEGGFEGVRNIGELKQHGDLGVGTFHRLDGELVGIGGDYYQVRSDGRILPAPDSMAVPYATVTFFEKDLQTEPVSASNILELLTYLDEHVSSENQFYAIQLAGTFPYVKTRAPPAQVEPYPRLAVALENQSVFEFRDIQGSIIGVYAPDYMKGITAAGYHLHFISGDRTRGGHLLDVMIEGTPAEIDFTDEFFMSLPTGGGFGAINLSGDRQEELKTLEQGRG